MYVARKEDPRNAFRILMCKLAGKCSLRTLRKRQKCNTRVSLREMN
jgi:hypothetical protein